MSFEEMAGHDLINVVRDLGPVEAVRDREAAERMLAYPKIIAAGPPEFGLAEQAEGVWRILSLDSMDPYAARIDLAIRLRDGAAKADPAVAAEMRALADLFDPEDLGAPVPGECAVDGRRYRIVRVPPFARLGTDGPEPVRATDVEGGPVDGFRLDPAAPVGPADATLRLELLGLVPDPGSVPDDERAEALAAVRAYPGVVLLPPLFAVVEDRDDHWRPITGGTGPQDARRALSHYFRRTLPRFPPPETPPPSPGELAEYARAADRIDAERGVEFVACGRRFRIARVARMIRVGPDGPEPARESDEVPLD
ncbi:hypothetical protein BJF79_38605 [Actinomadura sp. CNU-125]|uniref:DUF5954 family protein n=1 Tax=Actinomadura sp. CNU-125 TaxID=1904961 RepID=UPI0009695D51|nr:DUF5954 family protein [Actinomadura sp. CNU-125]OLT30562.1 hypothetical protein BJF79_38605 [Actinomadura sp. CNU-125]